MSSIGPVKSGQSTTFHPSAQSTSKKPDSKQPNYHVKTNEVATPRFIAISANKALVKKHKVDVEQGEGLSFLLKRNKMKETAKGVESISQNRLANISTKASHNISHTPHAPKDKTKEFASKQFSA